MKRDRILRALLGDAAHDPGCEETFAALGAYVDAALRGENVAERYARVVTHLENCPGCREDTEGLLAALRAIGPIAPPEPPNPTG